MNKDHSFINKDFTAMSKNLTAMSIDLENETYDFLVSIAKENGMTVADVAMDLIEREVKQWKKDLDLVQQLQDLDAVADTDPQNKLY